MTTPPPQDPFSRPEPEDGRPQDGRPQYGDQQYGQQPRYGQQPQYGEPQYGQQYGQQPGGYGPPPQAWGGSGYGGPTQTESKAVIALVLAIASWLLIPVLPAIAALMVGSAAQRDIDTSGGRLTGDGLVKAARIIAWLNIGLALLGVVLGLLALLAFAA